MRGLTLDNPIHRAILGSAELAAFLAAVAVVVSQLGATEQQVAINLFIWTIAVVGFGMYSGNSGIMTFGHVAFMGVAAYAGGILTMPPAVKEQALPRLAPFLQSVQLPLLPALLGALVVVAVVAFVFGLPLSRLSAAATPIATLSMLIIVYVVLGGAEDITRGSQTFYGVPHLTDLPILVVSAIGVVFLARLFRESVPGLRLRASREDELAARSMGVDVAKLRLLAWMLSALVVGVAGFFLGHNLTAFSPKQFYLTLQFALVAMLVVGGSTTVTGAVGGAFVITLLMEVARRVEDSLSTGFFVGPIHVGQVFGLQEMTLGLVILAAMYRRREGIFGRLEIDEMLEKWRRRRHETATRSRDAVSRDPSTIRGTGG